LTDRSAERPDKVTDDDVRSSAYADFVADVRYKDASSSLDHKPYYSWTSISLLSIVEAMND
jgi:hypothetical protein